MVRRTRGFILQHYTREDDKGRRYVPGRDGEKRYFPTRVPRTLRFEVDDSDPRDRYARLYSVAVVDEINALHVPRYGLGNYVDLLAHRNATPAEQRLIDNLGRAGKRLMGFCRTNLFKRLESSGHAFLKSIDRHVLRNEVYLYAIETGLELPLGALDAGLMEADQYDEDAEGQAADPEDLLDGVIDTEAEELAPSDGLTRAATVYRQYAGEYKKRFKWIRPDLFRAELAQDLAEDTERLRRLLRTHAPWPANEDRKLAELRRLVTLEHGRSKVLVFTQFADTARYLASQLQSAGIKQVGVATGASGDTYALACRFSPRSNLKSVSKADELRVLVCTDVLSEGQNLQDCSVVVNFDLPWAIIRLIQRAGRVDRIGQRAEEIHCYSFLPADGVEQLIQLRARIQQRLRENEEVVGTDEAFFEGDAAGVIRDLYTERAGSLDDEDDEVDLASYAWQVWKQATEHDPELARTVEALPPVVYSARPFALDEARFPLLGDEARGGGSLVYVKSPEGNDHLAWIGPSGEPVTESQFTILRAAECARDTSPVPRANNHHELVAAGLELAVRNDKSVGGGLGRPSSPRRRAYERLRHYAESLRNTLFSDGELEHALDELYARPLLETASDLLNRLMRSGVNDEELAEALKSLREENRLTYAEDDAQLREPRVVCSMGLVRTTP